METNQQLFFHINNNPLAIIEWDNDFRVKHWSVRAEEMFGWKESEVLGKHWRDWHFVWSEDMENVIGITDCLLNISQPRNISHNRNCTKDGCIIDCEWYNSILLDEYGNLISIFSLVQDVSEKETALRDLRLAQKILREREQKFNSILSSLEEVVWSVTPHTFEVLYVNVAATKIYGRQIAEFYDNPNLWLEVVHPEDRDRVLDFAQHILETESDAIEYRIIKSDGEINWLYERASLIRDTQGMPIRLDRITSNITERKQAEFKLRQNEAKFRAIFNQTYQFMGLLKTDGTVLEANQNSLDFIGLTLADVIGKPFWSTPWWSISLEIQEQLKEAISQAAKGDLVRYEVEHRGVGDRVITVDFSLKPLKDETGTVIMLIAESRNITEHKQAEAKIKQQAALLDIATDAIMVRGLDDRILFWNRGAEKLYGWTTAEALNRNANELLYGKSSTELSKIKQIVTEQGEWQGELNQVTKEGKNILVQSRWTLVRDEAGNPQSYLVVKHDITEQKQLENQFLRTQRLESLGTLASGIAHDLNNILAPILGFARLIPLKLSNLDEETKRFCQIIETNAQRGTALVKQILTFARGLEGERGTVQLRHLIAEIKQIIEETFPKVIESNISAPKNLWTVNGDINQLHQVLMNLVVNARDAMPKGGKLTIKAENFEIDPCYAALHLDAQPGSYVLITVADTGVGIPPAIIDRIFEPFFTTKEVGQGTGLGLSTVIGIVHSHGGFVDVASEIKEGTQFKVFLPAPETAIIDTEATQELPHGNGELILVVDDEPSILEATKATLETYNYRVLTAKDGIEAITLYSDNQAKISVVLMDLMMPEMSGLVAMETLKKINPSVKLIANSGLTEKEQITAAEKIAIKGFIAKPYTAEILLRQLKKVITVD